MSDAQFTIRPQAIVKYSAYGWWLRCVPVLLIVLSLLVVESFAGPRVPGTTRLKERNNHYVFRTWRTDDGLPQNSIQCIIQSRNGYIWFGTQEGLVRYDGTDFRVYDAMNTTLPSQSITAICESRDGSLWIMTEEGLVRMKNGAFARVPLIDSVVQYYVRSIHEDGRGRLWIATLYGLYCVWGDSCLMYTKKKGLLSDAVTSLCEDRNGDLIIGSPYGLQLMHEGELKTLMRSDVKRRRDASWIYPSADGGIWVASLTDGLLKVTNAGIRSITPDGLGSSGQMMAVLEDRSGAIWVGTAGGGLYRLAGDTVEVFHRSDGLAGDHVISLLEDHEGSIWVGTVGTGLTQMKKSLFSVLRKENGLSEDYVSSILQDRHGTIWLGMYNTGINRLRDGVIRSFSAEGGDFQNNRLQSTYVDSKGCFWVAMMEGGLYAIRGDHVRSFSKRDGLPPARVSFIAESEKLGLLVSVPGIGLYRQTGDRFVPLTDDTILARRSVNYIHCDRAGDLWIGTYDAMLFRVSPSGWTLYTPHDGLSRSRIMCINEDSTGALWIGTYGGGLQRLKNGSFSTCTMKSGLYDNTVFQMLPDDSGNYWMSSNKGIFSVRAADLNAYAEGTIGSISCVSYGTADGMPSRECNGGAFSAGWKMKDGRLWFPTVAGVAIVEPWKARRPDTPPPIVFEEVMGDHQSLPTQGPVKIAAGTEYLELHYAGLSFISPEQVEYRYRLDGFDRDWISAGGRRVAYYTSIPPGLYRFRVSARYRGSEWSADNTSLEIELDPLVYQTWWFSIIAVFLVAGLGAGTHRLYRTYRDRTEIAQRLRSQLALTQLEMLKSQLRPHFLFNTLNSVMVYIKDSPDVASAMIAQLSDLLRVSLEYQDKQEIPLRTELDLVDAYLAIQRVRFEDRLTYGLTVDPEGQDALVPTLILQPIVENAITHGFASTIGSWLLEIRAVRENGRLNLSVSDNGCGFPDGMDPMKNGGIGLTNVQARLRCLYGNNFTLTLRNNPQGGATVLLSIPYKLLS